VAEKHRNGNIGGNAAKPGGGESNGEIMAWHEKCSVMAKYRNNMKENNRK
jgi:hypothetical protein